MLSPPDEDGLVLVGTYLSCHDAITRPPGRVGVTSRSAQAGRREKENDDV